MIRANFNLIPSLVIAIFVLVSWTLFFSPCYADNDGFLEGFPIEGGNSTNSKASPAANKSTLILAAKRTRRIDPISHFSYYEAGWDITNKHYILSVAFSGAPLFVIAVLWFFIVGIGFISCFSCCGCGKSKSRTDYSRKAYVISLLFLAIFLIMTIIGGVFLYTGQGKFQRTASDASDILVTRANTVVDIVHNVMTNLESAKKIHVGQYNLPDDMKENIEKVESVASQIDNIKNQSKESAEVSTHLLKVVTQCLILVSSLMLILAVVGFIISIYGWKFIVYFLFFIGWMLVTCTFIMGGISLIVHNGVADTCVAMDDWVEHPQDHTALTELLPCMDEAAAQRTLVMTKNTSFQMVNLVNSFVTQIANADVPPSFQDMYYNQSGPLMSPLCNPFFPNLTERKCPSSEIELKAAPAAYHSFLCNTSPSGICITTGRLTPSLYSNIMVATNMSDTFHQHGPFLARLVDCSYVAETFGQITKEECPLLRRYSNQVFIGLLLLSVAVMFSLILWLVFVRERRLQTSSNKLARTHAEVQ